MSALLACPFCGGEAERHHDPGYGWYTTECKSCNCLMTEGGVLSHFEANTLWNRRSQPAALSHESSMTDEEALAFRVALGADHPLVTLADECVAEMRDPSRNAPNAGIQALVDACNGLLGLLQLIDGRDDVSAELRDVLRTNHRVVDAIEVVERAEANAGIQDAGDQPLHETAALLDVRAERRRQVEREGWTPDEHAGSALARAAAAYAVYGGGSAAIQQAHDLWPFERKWFKPDGVWPHRRNLVKAGALILAEIERLDRASGAKNV